MSIYPTFGLVWIAAADPTVAPGVPAPLNQFLIRTDDPSVYYKSGGNDTDWTRLGFGNILPLGVGDYYGNGADGDVIIGGVTINDDMYYNNLTLNGGNPSPGGYRLFVRNVLDMAGNIIQRVGNAGGDGTFGGLGGTAAAALARGSIANLGGSGGGVGGGQGGGAGGTGGTSLNAPRGFTSGNTTPAAKDGNPGQGGSGGNNSSGTLGGNGGTITLAPTVTGDSMYQIFNATTFRSQGDPVAPSANDWGFTGATGGGGGGGSVAAGFGGGGGGGGCSYPIFIAYRTLKSQGTLGATGGAGGDASQTTSAGNALGGGGGGGSGNIVVCVSGDGQYPTILNVAASAVPGSKVAGAPGKSGAGGGSSGGKGGDGLTLKFRQ